MRNVTKVFAQPRTQCTLKFPPTESSSVETKTSNTLGLYCDSLIRCIAFDDSHDEMI